MVVSLFAAREQFIIQAMTQLQMQIMDCAREKQRLFNFSSSVADGQITYREYFELPNDCKHMAQHYIAGPQEKAYQYAERNCEAEFQRMVANSRTYESCPKNDAEQRRFIYETMLKNGLDEARHIQEKIIAQKEALIDQKQKKLETRLQAYTTELAQVSKGKEQAVQQSTVKFVFG